MAKKQDGPIYGSARAQKDYNTWKNGDYWFSEEGNVMDNRKDSRGVDESGRARKMQAEDITESALNEAKNRLKVSGKKDAPLKAPDKKKDDRKKANEKR